MSELVCPIYALLQTDPAFLESLSPLERLVLPFMNDLWRRPDQLPARHDWRSLGFICGRGWGKSTAIAMHINDRVEAGELTHVALMAPNESRTEEVQVRFLVDMSPPWFKAERYKGGVRWPNGVQAIAFTPEAPGRSRSENIGLSWLCEIVDWQPSTRREAYDNITTATRIAPAQVIWDTTSMGRNEIIELLLSEAERDPYSNVLVRGTTFDNPLLSRKYLADVCAKYTGRRAREELWGEAFTSSAAALWEQRTIDSGRRLERPTGLVHTLVVVDPGLSARADADPSGIVAGGRDNAGHSYLLEDASDRLTPAEWGKRALDLVVRYDAAGVIVERNHLGDHAEHVIAVEAKTRGLQIRTVPRDKPVPRRTPGVLYVKGVVAHQTKLTRGEGPAAEGAAGRVHLVGSFPELEYQLTTYEGNGPSPNQFDAFNYLITELAELGEKAPDPIAVMVTAARSHEVLRERLRGLGRGRVGM